MTKTLSDLTLPISGMTCASCVSHVEGALKELLGVSNVTVNLATNKANLSYDPQRLRLDDMRRFSVSTKTLLVSTFARLLHWKPG